MKSEDFIFHHSTFILTIEMLDVELLKLFIFYHKVVLVSDFDDVGATWWWILLVSHFFSSLSFSPFSPFLLLSLTVGGHWSLSRRCCAPHPPAPLLLLSIQTCSCRSPSKHASHVPLHCRRGYTCSVEATCVCRRRFHNMKGHNHPIVVAPMHHHEHNHDNDRWEPPDSACGGRASAAAGMMCGVSRIGARQKRRWSSAVVWILIAKAEEE